MPDLNTGGRAMPKRGEAATPAQRAALERGQARKRAQQKVAKEKGLPRAADRWAMLLSGELLVSELDDDEIAKGRVRGADGGFAGRRRAMPSHLVQQFQAEAVRRATNMFREAAPTAVKRLLEIAGDPDTKDSDAIRALSLVLERSLGKVPDTIRVETQDDWGRLIEDALGRGNIDRSMDGAPDPQ
jgi:hypothetical protein